MTTVREELPGVDEIKRLLRAGETRTSIAYKYGYSRTAVSQKLTRAGEKPGQMRYNTMLPWRVRQPDLFDYAARMLRFEGRLRAGLPVGPDDQAKLASWKQDLADNDSVIMYLPDHDCPYCKGVGGFHPIRRKRATELYGKPDKRFDTELIFVTQSQGAEAVKRLGME